MSNKKRLKKILFKRGARAIGNFTDSKEDLYYCPICADSFYENSIETGELTLEHIPPEAQGGKGITLTCLKCNNTAGHTVDAAVLNRNQLLNLESIFTKTGSYRGRVKLSFGLSKSETVNFDISVKDGAVRLYLVEGSNRPGTSEMVKSYFSKMNQTPDHDRTPINIETRQRYHGWHSKVGDLRTAFLVCFAFFGYHFAFDKSLAVVRNQLLNYNSKIIDNFWWQLNQGTSPETKLSIIDKPFNALFVQLGRHAVLLPWVSSPKKFYTFLNHTYPNGGNENFSGIHLPWPQTLEMKMDFPEKENVNI